MFKHVMAGLVGAGLTCSAALAQPAATPPDHSNRIILLGTRGGPAADAIRSESASLLVIDGTPYLIDAGSGTSRRLAEAGYPLSRIKTIFITHHHLDHTAGLEPLISLSWIGSGLSGRETPAVNVYGPPATDFLVKAALNYLSVSARIFSAGIPSLPSPEGMFIGHDMVPGVVYQDGNVKVTAVENSHFGHPSYGPDGKKDMAFSYRFDTTKASIVFTGDTGPSKAVNQLAKGADILVSEASLPAGSAAASAPAAPNSLANQLGEHMAREHLSPEEIGKMAAQAGVKQVILYHLVIGSSPDTAQRLEDGVHKYFKGPVTVGRDLLSFDLDMMRVVVK